MKLQTRFNVDDTIFFLQNSKVKSEKVHSIQIELKEEIKITYRVIINDCEGIPNYNFATINEDECFASKVELIDSL